VVVVVAAAAAVAVAVDDYKLMFKFGENFV
jgi:hypothetical protein